MPLWPPSPPSPSARINHRYDRFVRGGCEPSELGVIVHVIDGFEDPAQPWTPCSPHDAGCAFLSDRLTASVVHRGNPALFAPQGFQTGGVVLAAAHSVLFCAFGGDGSTRGKVCTPPGRSDRCIPACIPSYDAAHQDSRNTYDRWCDPRRPHSDTDYWCDGRPWRPTDVGLMLERRREAVERHALSDHGYGPVLGYVDMHAPEPSTASRLPRAPRPFCSQHRLSPPDVCVCVCVCVWEPHGHRMRWCSTHLRSARASHRALRPSSTTRPTTTATP